MSSSRPNGFVELEELVQRADSREEWEETARWVTLEETVESDRWSKPHVPCLSLKGLQSVRNILAACPILFDVVESEMTAIVEVMVDELIRCGDLDRQLRDSIIRLLLLNHRHKNQAKASPLVRRRNRRFSVGVEESEEHNQADIDCEDDVSVSRSQGSCL